jgi:hypothetical protein
MIAELAFLVVAIALALPNLIVRAFDAGKHSRRMPPGMLPHALRA